MRINVYGTIQLVDFSFNHVHAHTTTGDITDLCLGREARREYQIKRFHIRHTGGGISIKHATTDSDFFQLFRIHPFTIIGDSKQDMIAFL